MAKEVSKIIRRYALTFLAGSFVFYIITDMQWFDSIRQIFLQLFASISAMLLSILGYGTIATEGLVASERFSVSIKEGCDALAPVILFSLATLLYPTSWTNRLRGWFTGLLALFLLNVIRIISLFMIGVHAPRFFDVMHVDVWQVVFIVITAVIWMLWVGKVQKNIADE